MDYKLIKENFERATENLMKGMPDDDSEFKAEYTDLKFEEGSVESHILEAVKMVMRGQSSDQIIASLKAALDTYPGYMNFGTDDEPEEADYDTETGEFIGEKKKKPTPEPKKEEVYGMGTSMDQSVAKKKGLAAARANGFVAGMPFREQMSMNPSTGEYTYKMIKI